MLDCMQLKVFFKMLMAIFNFRKPWADVEPFSNMMIKSFSQGRAPAAAQQAKQLLAEM